MKIGIFVCSIGNFGKKEYYNLQEIGLAKELSKYFKEVIVYKAVSIDNDFNVEKLSDYNNITLKTIPLKKIGTNSIVKTKCIDKDIDALFCFSDIQIFVPRIYRWCKKNKIKFLPYVGTIRTSSTSKIKLLIRSLLNIPVLSIYRKTLVLAKTSAAKQELNDVNIKNVIIAPVGLDIERFNSNCELNCDLKNIKTSDKIILMVGRLESDRSPMDGIELFRNVHDVDDTYKLVIIGEGSLENEIKNKIDSYNLSNDVIMISKVKNHEMKFFYNLASLLITFNRNEIFGMTILEAMYHGVPVYAMHAPGPDDIIENNISGYLFDNIKDMKDKIIKNDIVCNDKMKQHMKNRIINNFTWNKTAKIINKILVD